MSQPGSETAAEIVIFAFAFKPALRYTHHSISGVHKCFESVGATSWNEVKGIAGALKAWKIFMDAYAPQGVTGLDDDEEEEEQEEPPRNFWRRKGDMHQGPY
jgi:hypothetical protein